jgi:methyl-accepting chemotaxis protein
LLAAQAGRAGKQINEPQVIKASTPRSRRISMLDTGEEPVDESSFKRF